MEHSIIGLMFIEKPTEDDLPSLQVALQRILVDNVVEVIQYDYSGSMEAAEKRIEMYRLSKTAFFDSGSHIALCLDNKGNRYQIDLCNVSDEFKNKYLKVVEI